MHKIGQQQFECQLSSKAEDLPHWVNNPGVPSVMADFWTLLELHLLKKSRKEKTWKANEEENLQETHTHLQPQEV